MTASDWLAAYPPARSLTLDQEALRVYERAYYLGAQTEKPEDPPVSFTTLVAALLTGEDETSRWFAKNAGTLGPSPAAVFAEKGITDAVMAAAKQPAGPPDIGSLHVSADKQLLTGSSRAVLESAENWAQRVGGSDIGVRHLVASYVINPPAYHRNQLRTWNLNESQWRSVFFEWVAQRFTWEQWSDASQRAMAEPSRVAFEQKEVKGRSLAWPGDERARGILDQAARWHRFTNDAWLGFTTVFIALVQAAEGDPLLREEVLPIWNAVENARAGYTRAFNRYLADTESDTPATFADLDVSPRVLNTLETARELATAARARVLAAGAVLEVTPLHLAGALVSRRVDADEDLAALGINLQDLRRTLVAHATARGESVEAWREMLGEEETVLTGRPVDLNSDEPEAVVRLDEAWTSDPLAIRPDVEAFAALLASRDLEPPLSIGLFGPWGSGKTTFLKRLRRAVQRHADEVRQEGATGGRYVANIVHVEFNAWHFAEDALISSLVDATIRQISAYVRSVPTLGPKGWLDEKLKTLESRRRQVDASNDLQAAATAALVVAQTELVTREHEAAQRATSLRSAAGDVWKATTAALANRSEVKDSGVIEAVGSTVQDLDELHRRVDRLRARPGRMLGELGWTRSALFAVLILVVPPLAAILVARATGQVDFRAILSSLSALLVVLGFCARAASRAVSKVDQVVAQVVAEYERRIAQDPTVVAAQGALHAARANAQTAAAALQASREDLARATADAASASLPAQTLRLTTSRIEDRSYAKELTTLSLARADLEALSHMLRDQRVDSGEANAGLRPVDRVILYVDDLDRCRPEDVVRVLQLVHMLLAFELFVVVVAVDARWVEEALRQSYPWLSRSDVRFISTPAEPGSSTPPPIEPFGSVTPEDYLEKIFQIAFWLEPMTAGRAASYLTSLVRPSTPSTNAAPAGATASGASAPAIRVDISSVELDYMRALAAYVGSSPRRVKRLVNAYRLIKARLSDAQLAAFVTDRGSQDGKARSGPYQIVIGLLVIGTGSQSASSAILGELGAWDPRATYDDVVSRFRSRNDTDWTTAAQVIETIMRTQNATDVSEVRGWARKVGRFLLHGPTATLGASPPPIVPRATADHTDGDL